MLAIIPIMGGYLRNISEVSVQDLILPVALSVLTSLLIALAYWRSSRRQPLTAYFSALLLTAIVSNNYQGRLGTINTAANDLLPFNISRPLFTIGYLLLIVLATWQIARLVANLSSKRPWLAKELLSGTTIIVAVVFLSLLAPTVQNLSIAWPQFFYHPPKLTSAQAQVNQKPDIYYILLEDYTSQKILKEQFNFDNQDFLKFLSDRGFFNVPDANANYPYTVNSVASTFAADYLSDQLNRFASAHTQTVVPYFDTVRLSPVISQLKSLGYQYHLSGDWFETSNYSPMANFSYTKTNEIVFLNHSYDLDDFTDLAVHQSVLWPIINAEPKVGHFRLLGYNSLGTPEMSLAQFDKLEELAKQPAGGRVIFSQILLPHNYYYFNADGSVNPNAATDNVEKPVKQKYTNEIQFVNGRVKTIVDLIQKNSGGKANIVLLSDEGPQPGVMNFKGLTEPSVLAEEGAGNMTKWSQADLQMKYGVLASYYVPGASKTDLAQGANPVNVWRLILNVNFNSQLPYRPLCYYAYPQGSDQAFVYKSINTKLDQPDPGCPQNGNFINPGPTKLVPGRKPHSDIDHD